MIVGCETPDGIPVAVVRDPLTDREWRLRHWLVDTGWEFQGPRGYWLSESHPKVLRALACRIAELERQRCDPAVERVRLEVIESHQWILHRQGFPFPERTDDAACAAPINPAVAHLWEDTTQRGRGGGSSLRDGALHRQIGALHRKPLVQFAQEI